MLRWAIAALCALMVVGCSVRAPRETITGTGWVQYATSEQFQGNGFIRLVSLSNATVIEITFSHAMNPESLHRDTVRVISEKQGRDVTDAFGFTYSPESLRLTLAPLHPEFDVGSGNLVTIRVSSDVRDAVGQAMGQEFAWSFSL